jgi:exonuclease SbcC
MISELEIENFQSHKVTSLSFAPGVNVIIGQSDTGKSSIIRAINWVISNRPSGDSFRSNFSKDKTEVAIEFDTGFVVRTKGKSINKYETDGGELKALRTDVPQEVKDITRMQEINLQPQHKSYFLLDETPGNVAKAFNSVSGLEEMDAALKNINSKVRETSSKISHVSEKIDQLENDIEEMSWVDGIEKEIESLEKAVANLKELKEEKASVSLLVSEIYKKQGELKSLPDFSALPKIKEIQDLDSDINKKMDEYHHVFDIVSTIQELQTRKKACASILALDIQSTVEYSHELDSKLEDHKTVNSLVKRIECELSLLEQTEEKTEKIKQTLEELESQLEVCPTCGQLIKEVL